MVPGHKTQWYRFAEKVQMAIASSLQNEPEGGTSGLEVELNILDGRFHPVASVGSGPERRSFADFLHEERLPGWARSNFQLEVFHWMIELTTKPHFSAVATAMMTINANLPFITGIVSFVLALIFIATLWRQPDVRALDQGGQE